MDVYFTAEGVMDAFDQLANKYKQLAKGEDEIDSIFIGPSHVEMGVDEAKTSEYIEHAEEE